MGGASHDLVFSRRRIRPFRRALRGCAAIYARGSGSSLSYASSLLPIVRRSSAWPFGKPSPRILISTGCSSAADRFKLRGALRTKPQQEPRTSSHCDDLSLTRVREAVIIPMTMAGMADIELWHAIYDNEPRWFAWALAIAGLPTSEAMTRKKRTQEGRSCVCVALNRTDAVATIPARNRVDGNTSAPLSSRSRPVLKNSKWRPSAPAKSGCRSSKFSLSSGFAGLTIRRRTTDAAMSATWMHAWCFDSTYSMLLSSSCGRRPSPSG